MKKKGEPMSLMKRLTLCRDEQRDLARSHHARYWAHVLIGLCAILTPVTIAVTGGVSAPLVSTICVIASGVVTLALAIPFFIGRDKRRKAANMLDDAVETLREDENANMSEEVTILCDEHTEAIEQRKHRHEPCDREPLTEIEELEVMRDKGERKRLIGLVAPIIISVAGVAGTSIWWLLAEELDPALAPVALPILYSAGSALGIGIALVITFRKIKLEHAQAVYLTCSGCWYEAHLSGCEEGLTSLPQQPVNTYTNLAYLISGVFIGACS